MQSNFVLIKSLYHQAQEDFIVLRKEPILLQPSFFSFFKASFVSIKHFLLSVGDKFCKSFAKLCSYSHGK